MRSRIIASAALVGFGLFAATTVAPAQADDRPAKAAEAKKSDDSKDRPDKKEKGEGNEGKDDNDTFSFAVIGDIPYGQPLVDRFPSIISQINADADVRMVTHLGDIKNGSSKCTDEYFALIRADFDLFADPLVYTPGDNEWTDCHRTNNGAYNPLERLAKIRSLFFPTPGQTLGQKTMKVKSQAAMGFPENVRYDKSDVTFAAVHIVGSNNSKVLWTGKSAMTPEQAAEVEARTNADLALINDTFDHAIEEHSRAVVLQIQADMFDPTVSPLVFSQWDGFQTLIQTIASRSASFGKPVYLFDGDSHIFNVDKPLAPGSSWLNFYGVATPAANLTRITVDGSSGANNNNWLKVTIDEKNPAVLSWVKVPFTA